MSNFKQTLPNILTIARIISIPFLMAGILQIPTGESSFLGLPVVVLCLYLFAVFTDYLDGYLARRWNTTSDFGRMIDPIADKMFVAGCLLAICIAVDGDPLILVPAALIMGRDILVSGAREHAALKGRVMPPTQLAKWKTAFEMLAILLLIVWLASQNYMPIADMIPLWVEWSGYGGALCLWLAAILSVYTGALYTRAALGEPQT